ncbi:MAG: DMT family transporter [Solirubrobacterales bacterium]|nr:DMT family transporter [Solirubrobacterales bacterium]
MSTPVVALLIVLVGFQYAAQAPINGGLGRTVGPLAAALVSFSVGATILLLICVVSGEISSFSAIGDVPFWQLLGGAIGASYVAIAAITISRVGAGVIAAVTVTGQLLCSVVIDHFGWFGIEIHDVTPARVFGLVLLLVGAMAMLYSREEATEGLDAEKGVGGMFEGGANRERLLICVGIFLAAIAVGIQHPLNSELAGSIGDFPSGLVNFLTGLTVLTIVVVATGRWKGLGRIREAEPQYFLGGVIGVIVVVASLAAVTVIGAAGLTSALVAGQMIGSLVLDRTGAFGLTRIPIDRIRLAAAVALLAGTFLATG